MIKHFLASLFCFYSFFAQADLCDSIFKSQTVLSKQSTQHVQSLISILDYSLTNNLISEENLQTIHQGSESGAAIGVEKLPDDVLHIGVKQALRTLLASKEIQNDWREVQNQISKLLRKRTIDQNRRQSAKTETKFVMNPMLRKYTYAAEEQRSSQWHVTSDGRVYMAVTSWSKGLQLYDFRDLEHPILLGIGAASSTPTWHLGRNGESLLAAGNLKGIMFVYDVDDLAHPRKLKGAGMFHAPPAWHVEPNGQILIAVPSYDGYLYIFDVDKVDPLYRLPISKQEGGVEGAAAWEYEDGKKGRIAVSSSDQNIYIFDLEKSRNPNVLESHGNGLSAVLWFNDSKGNSQIFAGVLDWLLVYDLRNPTHPKKFPVPRRTSEHLSTHTLPGGKIVITVGSWAGKIYLFDPTNLTHPIILDTKIRDGRVNDEPTWIVSPDNRTFLAASVYKEGLFIFDLDDIEHPIQIPTDDRINSPPAWYTDPSGTTFLAVAGESGNLYVSNFYVQSGRK